MSHPPSNHSSSSSSSGTSVATGNFGGAVVTTMTRRGPRRGPTPPPLLSSSFGQQQPSDDDDYEQQVVDNNVEEEKKQDDDDDNVVEIEFKEEDDLLLSPQVLDFDSQNNNDNLNDDDDEEEEEEEIFVNTTISNSSAGHRGNQSMLWSTTAALQQSRHGVDDDDDPLLLGSSPTSEASLQHCLKVACYGVQELLKQVMTKDDPTSTSVGSNSSSSMVEHGQPPRNNANISRALLSQQQQQPPHQHTQQPSSLSPTTTDLSPTASSFDTDTSSLAGFLADYSYNNSTASSSNNNTNIGGSTHHPSGSTDPHDGTNTTTTSEKNRNDIIIMAAPPPPPLPSLHHPSWFWSSSSSPTSTTNESQVSHSAVTAAHRLGHASMVHLCSWTLEQVQGEIPILISPNHHMLVPSQQHLNVSNITQHESSTNDVLSKQQVQVQPTTPRFTMFASEYARHLSTSSSLAAFSNSASSTSRNHHHTLPPSMHHHNKAKSNNNKKFITTKRVSSGGRRMMSSRSASSIASTTDSGSVMTSENLNRSAITSSKGRLASLVTTSSSHNKANTIIMMPPKDNNYGTRDIIGNTNNKMATIPLLHQAEASVQSGAVLDLVVTMGDTPPPPGYFRILPGILTPVSSASTTSNASSATVSSTIGGKQQPLFLNCKKETNWDKAAQRPVITSLSVLQTPQDFVPPGYCVVKHADTKLPAKFGTGSNGAHLVFKRSREGNPITDIVWLQPPLMHIPNGYTVVEKTPRNHVAKIVSGNNNNTNWYFVAYRQRLANLEALRPLPLIRAAQPKAGADFVDHDVDDDDDDITSDSRHDKLHAYYATGATTVASAVGKYHILDRSTHRLQSPSSVQHRLALVQLSRLGSTTTAANTNNNNAITGTPITTTTKNNTAGTDSESVTSQWAQALEYELERVEQDKYHDLGQDETGNPNNPTTTLNSKNAPRAEALQRGGVPVTMLRHFFKLSLEEPIASSSASANNKVALRGATNGGVLVQQCWNALSFIPAVETCGNAWLLQERMVILTPILTACYTRHGGAAHVAVQTLMQLLADTDFFADDMVHEFTTDEHPTGRVPFLTLLDLAVQAVCDVATTSCSEAQLAHCVDFVQLSMTKSQGYLSSRSLGYVWRFYLFVFYFGASTCTNSSWPNPKWQRSPTHLPFQTLGTDTSVDAAMEIGVLTDPRDDANQYLPGGAPQAAALALKDYIHALLLRLGTTCVLQKNPSTASRDIPEQEEIGAFVGSILSGLVDNAVEHVERANYTQLAYYQIHRSGGSELFWHDMITTCAPGLFRNDPDGIFAIVFSVLANLVKVALGKVRNDRSLLHSRDVASKLLSLELLLYFLELYSDELEVLGGGDEQSQQQQLQLPHNPEFVFSIRRMVVPCLLSNTRSGLENPQVFIRIIRIVSTLWLSPIYRQQCKVELGILMEHFGLRLLQMKPQLISSTQLDLWSDAAQASLLAQQLEVIHEVKKWCTDPKDTIELFLNYDTDVCMTGPVQIVPGTRWKLFQRLCTSLTFIAEQCSERIGKQIQESRNLQHKTVDHCDAMRLLRTASLETISQIVQSLAVSAAASSSSDKFTKLLLRWAPCDVPQTVSPSKPSKQGDDQVLRFWRDAIAAEQQEKLSNVAPTHQESRKVALEIAKQKNLKKAIEYLIACNSLSPSPRDIANFLRLQKDELDPASLGEYLSESGVGVETEWWKSIRQLYVRAISFVGMQVEEGLRHFLTNCGFRLPGEAQRIDRIMSTFAKCYFEDNAGDSQRCPFKYEDTVYLLSFAIIMLNTDLHKRSRKKMTKAEFINNLRGVEQGEDIPKEYLGKIYDSIEANPIVMDPESSQGSDENTADIQSMLNNVRSSDTLLRGLAVHDFHFATIDDFCDGLDYRMEDALADLTRCCVSQTWHQWHGVVNTALETAHLDPLGMGPSMEILLYALTLTVCLDMPTERAAFLSQVGRLKAFEERRQGRYVSAGEPDISVGDWFRELEEACCGSEDRKLSALKQIRDWMLSFQETLDLDTKNKITMQAVVRQIKDSDDLLQDPARFFLRAGNLIKKSSRTGRSIAYRFYLFSDVLLYAKEDSDGRFNVHEELPLHLLKVVDWFPPSQKNRKVMFEVCHPRKSFTVLCPNAKERKNWVRDIKSAVQLEMERKVQMEAARMAAAR